MHSLLALLAACFLSAEYASDPLGVDATHPRLGWTPTQEQTAYRVLAATSVEKLDREEGNLWDSGCCAGGVSAGIVWGGRELASSQRVYWRVMTWDRTGKSDGWSETGSFTTGIMKASDWKAQWIGPAPETRPDEDLSEAKWIKADPKELGASILEHRFTWTPTDDDKPVEFVFAAVAQHEITVNGKPFDVFSGYIRDWRYLRFRNLRPWLKPGENVIRAKVWADPGVRGDDPIDAMRLHAPRDVWAFIAKIVFPDGRVVSTDRETWTTPLAGGTVSELSERGAVRSTWYGEQLVMRSETSSPAFARAFTVTKPLEDAVLHVTGVGFYEASLNGGKVGRKVLDPSPTAFDRRVLYSTYRVTDQLREGENELRILVGHGWYDMRSVATWNFDTAPWRDFPRTIAQLELFYRDGSRETVVTDGTWRQVKSPVAYDDLYEGEVAGDVPVRGVDPEANGLKAAVVPGPKGTLCAEVHPGAEVCETIRPKEIWAAGDGTYIADFGRNLTGWMRMTIRGQQKGDVVSFRYDERVRPDTRGPVAESVRDGIHNAPSGVDEEYYRIIDVHFRYPGSHRVCPTDAAMQTDRHVCSGAEADRYEPRFQYHGFRYVVIRGLRAQPSPNDLEACFVHTAFRTIGSFSCSDETFNTLVKMGDRAYRSNFTDGVPTDCPHREKNGWTGDASIAAELAQYCYENTAAYEKWLKDICDSQLPDGNISCIVPSSGWGYHWGNGPAWDSALPVIAWNLWTYRGDRGILENVYGPLLKYLDYTASKADANGLVGHGLGDWIPVVIGHMPSTEFTSSCYYFQAQEIGARIAALTGDMTKAGELRASAARTRQAIHAKYYHDGTYDNDRQTALGMALAFGIVPEAARGAVEARLVQAVEREGCHVDMGLLGMKHVFRALARMGRADLAWRMILNPTWPGPTYWIQRGGTTLWEDWKSGASRNHVMFADYVGWAYQYLAGIRLAEDESSTSAVTVPVEGGEGFREIEIAPCPVEGLAWVKASVQSPRGCIASEWRVEKSRFELTVTIPKSVRARVRLPDGSVREVQAGRTTLSCCL